MITLLEELVLLAVNDDGGMVFTAGSPSFGRAVVGACLVELSEAGRIDADLSAVRLVSSAPTGSAVADRVLAELAAGEPAAAEVWVQRLQEIVPELVRLALRMLVERGVLEQTEARFLWVLRARRYPVIDGREQKEAKLRIVSSLLGDEVPTPHDTALVGLACAGGLLQGFLSNAEIARLQDRINLVGGIDLFVKGVESAIRTEAAIRAQAYMIPMV
jgi:hypothetical protein